MARSARCIARWKVNEGDSAKFMAVGGDDFWLQKSIFQSPVETERVTETTSPAACSSDPSNISLYTLLASSASLSLCAFATIDLACRAVRPREMHFQWLPSTGSVILNSPEVSSRHNLEGNEYGSNSVQMEGQGVRGVFADSPLGLFDKFSSPTLRHQASNRSRT